MRLGKIFNTMCLLKSVVCLENFNLSMNSPKKNESDLMLVQSKNTSVGDKRNVNKYYKIIR